VKYWINTVSKDHVLEGKKNNFVQANHGKLSSLKKLNIGDKIIFYSPKTALKEGKSLKSFTAIASIKDDNIYQVELSKNFKPYRLNAIYEDCKEIKIKPLINKLVFIKNKKYWGYKFRLGLFEISKEDFERIYSVMKSLL